MTKISISLKGIEQAITDLNYKKNSIKQRILLAIRAHYLSEDSIAELNAIHTDDIVKSVWNTGDNPVKIRAKRRNFSSLKSSINADLKKISTENKNPENITITPANIFDMNEDAKNDLLKSFSNAVNTDDVDLNQVSEILKIVTNFLSDAHGISGNDTFQDIISQVQDIITKVSKNMLPDTEDEKQGAGDTDQGDGGKESYGSESESSEIKKFVSEEDIENVEDISQEDTEEIKQVEIDDDEDLEEVELDEDEELEEAEIDEDEDLEEVEIDGDEDLEEIELDEDEELEDLAIDEDAQLGLDETLEEIDELNENQELEEAEIDEDEDLEEVEISGDEDLEEIELDEDEELEEVEIDEDNGIEEPDAYEDDTKEIETDDDEDLEEVEIDGDEDLEEIDELNEEEIQALENYEKEKELAAHFDNFLGESDKKYNAYLLVPAGTYTVGSKRNFKNTLKLQEIDMPEIYIARYPVTNSLFEIFVEQTGYITLAEKKGFGTVFYGRFKKGKKTSIWKKTSGSTTVAGACWYQPLGPGSTLHGKKYHPVVQISMEDAWAFASWIGRRLPSEAQWEACARTDMSFRYPWGNEWKDGCCNIEKSSFSDTTPVDKYDNYANAFKISDLLGNVLEWTSDTEQALFDSDNTTIFNIAKGGGWTAKNDITITSRSLFKPGFSSNITGFRCISEKFL